MRKDLILMWGITIIILVACNPKADVDPGTLKWEYAIEDSLLSPPALGTDGTIYFSSSGGTLYALNHDGTLKWKHTVDFKNWYIFIPSVGSDGTVYFSNREEDSLWSTIYAFNSDGSVKWSYEVEDPHIWSVAPIGSDGTVYFTGEALYAFSTNGSLKWQKEDVDGAPAIGPDGTLYCFANYADEMDAGILALNPDGSEKWKSGGAVWWIWTPPAIDSEGNIIISCYGLFALNPDGSPAWGSEDTLLEGTVLTSPAIGEDGTIYVNTFWGDLFAVASGGQVKWTYHTDGELYFSPAIGSDGTIYFGSYDSSFYALNSDGTLRWQFQTGGTVNNPPAIADDGTIYFTSNEGSLYAVNSDSRGLASSPWPKFGHDNQNTCRAQ